MAKTGSDHHDRRNKKTVVGRRRGPRATSDRKTRAEVTPARPRTQFIPQVTDGPNATVLGGGLRDTGDVATRPGGGGDGGNGDFDYLKRATLAAVDAVASAPPVTLPVSLSVQQLKDPREVPPYTGRAEDEEFFRRVIASSERTSFPRIKSYLDRLLLEAPESEAPSKLQTKFKVVRLLGNNDFYRLLKLAVEARLLLALDAQDSNLTVRRDRRDEDSIRAAVAAEADRPLWVGTSAQQQDLSDLRGLLGPQADFILPPLSALEARDRVGSRAPLRSKLERQMFFELIWSYWMEEGMLVQSINAITMRFQNRRVGKNGGAEALNRLEIGPLRTLNPLLYSYIQTETERLSVLRRSYEYDHHYGLRLFGKAITSHDTADSRSNFLQAFHRLLHATVEFYRQSDDLTVRPDPEPIFNGLRDLEMLLGEGMHNQYGDLPWNARVEMITQQWMLSLPEMVQFLGGRENMPFPETWMDRVETMKGLMGWRDASILHYWELANTGERILVSVRFGDWNNTGSRSRAWLWAEKFREDITRYIYAYNAVTGVDLAADIVAERGIDATLPGVLLTQRRSALQER